MCSPSSWLVEQRCPGIVVPEVAGRADARPGVEFRCEVEAFDDGGTFVDAPLVSREHPHDLELVAVGVGAVDALGGAVARLAGRRMVIASDGITTAGAAFGHVDLALAVVRSSSPAVADLVTRYLVVDERPSQSLYAIPSALAQSDPTVSAFERWVRERLSEPISNPQAAKAIGVSERTLQRAVQRTLGIAPIRFIQDLRIERASHLLRTTEQSMETISGKVGSKHPNTLRVLLRERTGKTTAALRGV